MLYKIRLGKCGFGETAGKTELGAWALGRALGSRKDPRLRVRDCEGLSVLFTAVSQAQRIVAGIQ